jgi:replicative DNA helicase
MTSIPYSELTEAAVCGAVCVWPDRVLDDVVATGLAVEDFYTPRFSETWWAIEECVRLGQPVDVHTVAARVGDPRVIAEAIDEASQAMPGNAPAWARIVIDHARCRDLLPDLVAALRAAEAGQLDAAITLCESAIGAARRGGDVHAGVAA